MLKNPEALAPKLDRLVAHQDDALGMQLRHQRPGEGRGSGLRSRHGHAGTATRGIAAHGEVALPQGDAVSSYCAADLARQCKRCRAMTLNLSRLCRQCTGEGLAGGLARVTRHLERTPRLPYHVTGAFLEYVQTPAGLEIRAADITCAEATEERERRVELYRAWLERHPGKPLDCAAALKGR